MSNDVGNDIAFKTSGKRNYLDSCIQNEDDNGLDALRDKLEVMTKRLRAMEEQVDKKNEQLLCYICLCPITLPLQVCEKGHYACAACLHQQIEITGGYKTNVQWNTDIKLVCEVEVETSIVCGQCKSKSKPKYPGPLVSDLMDPKPNLTCPMCFDVYTSSQIAMHVLQCKKTVYVSCPFCKEKVCADLMSNHIYTECCKIKCRLPNCKVSGTRLILESHVRLHELIRTAVLNLKKQSKRISAHAEMIIQNPQSYLSPQQQQKGQYKNFLNSFLYNLNFFLEKLVKKSNARKRFLKKKQNEKRMCTLEVNALELFDIHYIKPSNDFRLHAPSVFAACQQQANLLTFCLLPPTSRLQTMCTGPLNALFDDVLDGKYATLNTMPIVWDTIEDPIGNPNNWIDVIPNGNKTILYPNEPFFYLGLQPLPAFITMAFSNNQTKMLGVFGGVLYETDATLGLVVRRDDVFGVNDTFQSVVVNALGTMGMVLFSNKLYVYYANTYFNITTIGYTYQFIQMFNNDDNVQQQRYIVIATTSNNTCVLLVYLGDSTINQFQLVKRTVLPFPTANSLLQWCSVLPTKEETVVAFDDFSGTTYPVYIFNNTIGNSTPPQLTWNVTRAGGPLLPYIGRWTAVARLNSGNLITVLACNRNATHLLRIVLNNATNTGTTALLSNSTIQVVQDSNFLYLCYIATDQLFAAYLNNPVIIVPAHGNADFQIRNNSILAFNADGLKTWVYNSPTTVMNGDAKLYQNANSLDGTFGDNFLYLFDLYVNRDAHVSDYGLFNDNAIPQPIITWFFGYRIYTEPIVPGTIILSPHQYYRLVVGAEVINNQPNAFAHITMQLQRANLTAMLLNNQGGLKLYDNADASIGDLWKRFATDQWSSTGSSNPFVEFSLPVLPVGIPPALVSANGLYILYKPIGSGMRVVYNVYNNGGFAEYCFENPERTARAVQRMQEFCFSQLRQIDDINHLNPSLLFKDKRCSCIAGERFATEIINKEGLDIYLSATTRAQFIDNLPCLLNSCQETLATPEQTLVYNVVKTQCQNADLTICSSTLFGSNPEDPTQLTIRQGVISQTCGGNLRKCGQGALCPEGSYCVDGTCVQKCTNNSQCAVGAQCKLGVCIAPAANNSNQTAQITLIIVMAIILILVVAVILVGIKNKKK